MYQQKLNWNWSQPEFSVGVSMRDAFVHALSSLASNDPRIVLITGDLGYGVLTDFANNFPNQFINAGVAEQNMTAIACGLALEGFKPYTYSIGNFPTLRCLEQIRNDLCYHDADVTIVAIGGGFSYGQLGMSHFALEDLAIMRALPNMRVVAPADPWEAKELTSQLYHLSGPTYLRIDKGAAELMPTTQPLKLGEVREVRPGDDITIVTIGAIAREAIKASDELSTTGVSARVLVVHSLKPISEECIIAAAKDTGGIITLEEHSIIGGLGSTVAEICLDNGVPPKTFHRMGLKDIYPSIVGDQEYLRKSYGLVSQNIIDIISALE